MAGFSEVFSAIPPPQCPSLERRRQNHSPSRNPDMMNGRMRRLETQIFFDLNQTTIGNLQQRS